MTSAVSDERSDAQHPGEPTAPNEALASVVVDDLVAVGLIRPADRSRVLEGLVAGKIDGSTWRLLFENQLEAAEASDAAR